MIQNTQMEKDLGVGRAWDHSSLGAGKCHISGFFFYFFIIFFYLR
jgi:hypothetical protein